MSLAVLLLSPRASLVSCLSLVLPCFPRFPLPQLPLTLLRASTGHPVLVELKNGDTYSGVLVSIDSWMNMNLADAVRTSAEGDAFWSVPQVYIRGNTVKYVGTRWQEGREGAGRPEGLREREGVVCVPPAVPDFGDAAAAQLAAHHPRLLFAVPSASVSDLVSLHACSICLWISFVLLPVLPVLSPLCRQVRARSRRDCGHCGGGCGQVQRRPSRGRPRQR